MRSSFTFVSLVLALVFLMACQPANDSKPPVSPPTTASKVVPVVPLSTVDLDPSGVLSPASNKLDSIEKLRTLVDDVLSSQLITGTGSTTQLSEVLEDLQYEVINVEEVELSNLSDTMQDSVEAFMENLKDFPTAKTAHFHADLSGQDFGQYLRIAQAKADLTVGATGFDGGSLEGAWPGSMDFGKVKSLGGSLLVSLEAESTTLPSGPVKDVLIRANLGGDGSLTFSKSIDSMSLASPGTLTLALNYRASASVAASVVGPSSGLGGKVVVTLNAGTDKTKAYTIPTSHPVDVVQDFFPADSFSVTLDAYDDANTLTFTKTYATVQDLLADFSPTEVSEFSPGPPVP